MEVGLGGVEGFEEFLGRDLAGLALVLARVVGHAGDAVVFVAVEPGLDGAPGELAWVALLVEEGHGGDVVDAFVAGSPVDGVDGAEDAHLQIDRRLLHECSPVGGPCWGEGRLKHKRSGQRRQLALLAIFADVMRQAALPGGDNSVTGTSWRWRAAACEAAVSGRVSANVE